VQREGDDRGEARLLHDVECDQRLFGVGERLRDDEVDSGIDRPGGLLLEHPANGAPRLVVRGKEVRVRQIAREQCAALVGDVARQLQRAHVQLFEQVLLADDPQLLAVTEYVNASTTSEPAWTNSRLQLRDHFGMVEHDLWDECAGLEVAAALAFEEVALGADDRSLLEPLEQALLLVRRHVDPLVVVVVAAASRVSSVLSSSNRGSPPTSGSSLRRRATCPRSTSA